MVDLLWEKVLPILVTSPISVSSPETLDADALDAVDVWVRRVASFR